jgi:hypothetical protein
MNIAKLPELLRKPSDTVSPNSVSPLLRAMPPHTASLARQPPSDLTCTSCSYDFGNSGRAYCDTLKRLPMLCSSDRGIQHAIIFLAL